MRGGTINGLLVKPISELHLYILSYFFKKFSRFLSLKMQMCQPIIGFYTLKYHYS